MAGSTTTTTVPSTNNKISAVGGSSYTYDSAGNITADGTNTYVWSAAGNLATVNTTGGVYTYNIANQRSKKVAGGNTIQYVYGANGLLYGEYTNAGALIREYVYLNGEPLAQIDAGTPEVLTYIHTDHLGTPRFGTNTGGTQVWTWASDGFGVGAPSGSRTVNLRMPGQYYDSESGLFYNWNRYYNPAIGRYISVDPIGTAGGMNTFLYAEANPLLKVDPEGKVAILGIPVYVWVTTVAGVVCIGTDCANQAADGIQDAIDWAFPPKPTPADVVKEHCPPGTNWNTQDDGDSSQGSDPDKQDLVKIKEKEANKAAQEAGYKDAHDAKKGRRSGNGDLYKDKKTGKVYVWDGKKTSEPELID